MKMGTMVNMAEENNSPAARKSNNEGKAKLSSQNSLDSQNSGNDADNERTPMQARDHNPKLRHLSSSQKGIAILKP